MEKKKAAALEEKLKKAEAEAAAAAAELEKKLKLANTDATAFAVYFEDLQTGINKLNGLVLKMEKAKDKETAAKAQGRPEKSVDRSSQKAVSKIAKRLSAKKAGGRFSLWQICKRLRVWSAAKGAAFGIRAPLKKRGQNFQSFPAVSR